MPNAQEWLDQNYPREGVCQKNDWYQSREKGKEFNNFGKRREEIEALDITWQCLEGPLALSGFVNLEKLHCTGNRLTSLNVSKNTNLEELHCNSNVLANLDLWNNLDLKVVKAYENDIAANLNIFSNLTKLQKLDLGLRDYYDKGWYSNPQKNNNFSGSLKALKNCKDLEYLCIGYQPNIKGGLEYLPAAKLTYFGCDGTAFQDQLRPFDYDIYAWQLAHPELMAKVKHPEREKANYRIELEEEIAEKENLINWLEKRANETKSKLKTAKTEAAEQTKKIARLESKLKILEQEKEKLENQIKILSENVNQSHWKIIDLQEENKQSEEEKAKLATEMEKEKTDHQQTKQNHQSQLKDLTTILFPSNLDNFAFANLKKQASKISQENQQAQVKILELENHLTDLFKIVGLEEENVDFSHLKEEITNLKIENLLRQLEGKVRSLRSLTWYLGEKLGSDRKNVLKSYLEVYITMLKQKKEDDLFYQGQLTILTKILAEKLNERERQIITQKQKEVCELETQLLALGCQEQKIQEIYQKVSENSYQAQIQISPQNN